MTEFGQIKKIIDSGSKEQKIRLFESLSDSDDAEIISLMVLGLDDADIEVRGEAFSSLVLNENDISDILIENLKNQSKNVRGYSVLVLANRNDKKAISEIIQLTRDESAMVRSCAVGALGYLKASEAHLAIRKCLDDPNIEVKKSAIKSAIDVRDVSLLAKLEEFSKENDPEINNLIVLAKNNL
ncbi:MAG: HEAT repeat domain-containing protein [Nitrososphaerota archaeon]